MLNKVDHLIKEDDPLLTRKAAVAYLNSLGLPMSFPWFEKLALDGRGPPTECYWGRHPCADAAAFGEWGIVRAWRQWRPRDIISFRSL